MEDLLLTHSLCPGDVVINTAVVRDLHRAFPGRFRTAVRTPCPELWWNNPHVVPADQLVNPRTIQWGWTAAESNERHRHLIQVWADNLGEKIGVKIPMTDIRGDLYLSQAERDEPIEHLTGERGPYWVVMAGGKADAGTKIWPSAHYQAVVNALAGKIRFVQCGRVEPTHFHNPLAGVCNMLGKTDCRQFMRLIHHADGVLCPVTFAMHLAAAVPTRVGRPKLRACVVVAGGREPPQLVQYPGHTFLHSIGKLSCSSNGSCWKDHTTPKPDRKANCHQPCTVEGQAVARCMSLITPADVVRAIESYYEAGAIPR